MADLTRRSLLTGTLALGSAALGSTALGATPAAATGSPSAATAPRRAPALVRSGLPTITHGVQSGDVTATTGTVWARVDRPARLVVEVSRDSSFRHARRLRSGLVTPETDFTGRIGLRGLRPGTDLYYRVLPQDPESSATGAPVTGRLRTAPRTRDDVRFVWSGDIAGQGWGINPEFGGFRMADVMLDLAPDFFLCSGDTVYADGPLTETVQLPDGTTWRNLVTPEKAKVAETLDEFRGQYAYNLTADNWREFLARTPQINQWDDHEVVNNWYPGEILEDDRYTEKNVDVLAARARQAFFEYLPISPTYADGAGRVYRRIKYGPLLDVFVLDMRTHKDPNTDGTETVPDGGVLGHEQTEWLKRELKRSRAVWKVIAADLPLGLIVADGDALEGIANGRPGAPAGRELDIAPVLSFLKHNRIHNVVWLTADVHYTAAHHYSPERAAFTDFDPFWEFVSGPLNAGGFGPNQLDPTFGPEAVFVEAPPRANTSPAEGHQYVGEVSIDGATAEFTVRLVGVDGSVRWETTLQPHRR
ncbi:alkaline phosphatase D family protein [Phytoactinopolyspora halotolerans]|uniref:Alkaline phosphatase n=1 Tax=Phytoactinopolyspora halotolerans TaxID=1981512 RepID=A0A6L9S9X0_9ACTN|nr:alkaline phosphatase D family protein [Phytoactinopolyspora halotolerans]NEE01869.1 alkaline phosphatase [Phytoactinopolyspora halotolerans]